MASKWRIIRYQWVIAALVTVLLCVQCAMAAETVLGSTTELLTSDSGYGARSDASTLGYALADGVREALDTQVALVWGGEIADCQLAAGTQTEESVSAAIARDDVLAVGTVTPKELRTALEAGVAHIQVDSDLNAILHEESEFDGFPQVSGISFLYDVSAPVGQRILWIRLEGEGKLDLEDDTTDLTLAAPVGLFQGENGYPALDTYQVTELTLSQALAQLVSEGITQRYGSETRMTVAGCDEAAIIRQIPYGVLLMAVALFAVGGGMKTMRTNANKRDHDNKPDWGMY